MGTTAQKLQAIANSKAAIKQAIENKGVQDVGDVLAEYPQKISDIKDTRCGISLDDIFVVKDGVMGRQINQQVTKRTALSAPGVTSLTNQYALQCAFYKTSTISAVYFPDLTSVPTFGLDETFYQPTRMYEISMPKVKDVGSSGMRMIATGGSSTGGNALSSLNLSSLETIGVSGLYEAFPRHINLKDFNMGSLVNVGNYGLYDAFQSCTHLPKWDEPNLSSVGDYGMYQATYYASSLAYANMPNLKTIGQQGMRGCFYYTGISAANMENVESIGNYCFYQGFQHTTKLKSFSLPKLTTIPTYGLFWALYQSGVEEVNLSSVTTVGTYGLNNAFYGCNKLKKVWLSNLSSTTTNSLVQTFYGCTKLELVDFSQAAAVPALQSTNSFTSTNSTYKIVVPDALYDTWIATTNWSSSSIKSHIVRVSDYTYT